MSRSPIWLRLFSPGELIVEALSVSRADCVGQVDGVTVDFQHSDLPPGWWEPAMMWHSFGNGPARFRWHIAPFLFPFEHDKDDMALASTFFGSSDGVRPLRVFAGDRISVVHVETVPLTDRDFDDPNEQVAKCAHLKVTRGDGTEEIAPWVLQFFGRANIRDTGLADSHSGPSGLSDAMVYERLLDRIERNAADFLNAESPLQREADHRSTAAVYAHRVHEDLNKLLDVLDAAISNAGPIEQWGLHAAKVDAVRIAANAIRAGFNLARHDLEPAEKRVKGQNKGLSRRSRDKTEDDRLPLAASYWRENPKAGLYKVARFVADQLALSNPNAPSEANVRQSILAAHGRAGGFIPITSSSYQKYAHLLARS